MHATTLAPGRPGPTIKPSTDKIRKVAQVMIIIISSVFIPMVSWLSASINQRAQTARNDILVYQRVISDCDGLNMDTWDYYLELYSLDEYLANMVLAGQMDEVEANLTIKKFLDENMQRTQRILSNSEVIDHAIFNSSITMEREQVLTVIEYYYAEDLEDHWQLDHTRLLLNQMYSVDAPWIDGEPAPLFIIFNITYMRNLVHREELATVVPFESAARFMGLAVTILGFAVSLFALQMNRGPGSSVVSIGGKEGLSTVLLLVAFAFFLIAIVLMGAGGMEVLFI